MKMVDDADALAGLEILGVVAHLERVQLLEDRDRNGHAVVLNTLDRVVVVKEDGGVDDEDLDLGFRGRLLGLALVARRFLGRLGLGLGRSVPGVRFQIRSLGRQVRSVVGHSHGREEAPGSRCAVTFATSPSYSEQTSVRHPYAWTSSR